MCENHTHDVASTSNNDSDALFCDDCSSLLEVVDSDDHDDKFLVCKQCEEVVERVADVDYLLEYEQEVTPVAFHDDTTDDDTFQATTEVTCPECGHDRATWAMKQIRSADESETRFFTCTECSHSWREDDH